MATMRFLNKIAFTALTVVTFHIIEAVEILRPRGVSISRASLYDPDKDFTCLDGTFTIPFLQVNDDYCDCVDGSDEPGTPACPNGTFHCTNAGHQPLDIPSSRVNDGVCDCCDASDEFDNKEKRGGGTCTNTCMEMGRAAREKAQRLAELQRHGAETRREMARRGREMQAERSDRLTQLRKDREEAEALKSEREAAKTLAEQRENAVLAKYREAEELEKQKKDGEVTEDEAKFFLDQYEEVSEEEFIDNIWKRMQPFYMMEQTGIFNPPEPTAEQVPQADEGKEVTTEGEAEEIGGDVETDDPDDDDEDDRDDEKDIEDADEGSHQVDDDRQPIDVQYDEETQQIVDVATQARHDFEEADRALRDVQREVRQLEEALEKDYGPDHEFSPLDGECFEYTDREYIYKLCPFDQATQRPKLGGSETRLGTWGQWAGPEHNKFARMMYDRGQGCWNGPQRSTLVVISCGVENELISVSEPNRCEYKFEFVTPAVCRPPEAGTETRTHDEL
ncbi:hypothetical protein B566_EDAN007615 [Ephemera danica]|nr:hypothetical protein B566_EDAN007615 [Ephemera danica]